MANKEQGHLDYSTHICSDKGADSSEANTNPPIQPGLDEELFEWMTEPEVVAPTAAINEHSADDTLPDKSASAVMADLSVVPWQTYCSLPNWGVHMVKVHCDTNSSHSTLYGTFRQSIAGKVALDLGHQTIDLPAMGHDGDTVVSIEVEVEGNTLQVAARLTATSGPISLRLGRDALAGRFLVDSAKRSEGNA